MWSRRNFLVIALGTTLISCTAPTPSSEPTIESIPSPTPTPAASLAPQPSVPNSTATAELPAPRCSTREAQGDGRIGQVVYGQDGIWLHDLDSGERSAFPEGERFLQPAGWSPDGRWRALAKEDGSLWIESADGTERRQLLPAGSGVRGSVYWTVSPVHWSPDGNWIAYLVAREENGQPLPDYLGIWRIHPDGSEPTEVFVGLQGAIGDPKLLGWSPGSKFITFWGGLLSASLDADGMRLYTVPSEGSAPKSIGWTLGYPDFLAWSPAGDCLALTDGGGREVWYNKQIVVVTPDGSARANLSNDPTRADIQPAWSPDARKIAYVSRPVPEQYPLMTEAIYDTDIWVMNADGTDKRQLTLTESAGEYRPLWSPDGEHILFARVEDKEISLWVTQADGENPHMIAELPSDPLAQNYYGHFDLTGLFAWYPKGG